MSLEEDLLKPRLSRSSIKKSDYLSTGSTLLNLACSGMPDCGIFKGGYFWGCGDSSSGKTMLVLGILAEACKNKNWDEYELFFDDVENGALMDFEKFFGKKMASRVKSPKVDDEGQPLSSSSIEDFYFTLDDKLSLIEKGKAKPFIYVLDSMDALTTKYERKKFLEAKTAAAKGTKPKEDFGDGKAIKNSRWMRGIIDRIEKTNSTLIVLSQTRDNVGGGLFDPKSVTAGGRSLKFYASLQLWTSGGPKLKKSVNGTERQVGITSRIAVKKNRLTGKEWTIEIPIYHSFGIDDIGSCVDFLVKEKRWKGGKEEDSRIVAKDFELEGSRDHIIRKIEENGLEFDLRDIVAETWQKIEEACQIERKPRYE